jgi:hypothetical protein
MFTTPFDWNMLLVREGIVVGSRISTNGICGNNNNNNNNNTVVVVGILLINDNVCLI